MLYPGQLLFPIIRGNVIFEIESVEENFMRTNTNLL
jgi:hypothetical protein